MSLTRLRVRLASDRGLTLVELMVASLAAAIIGAVMLAWLINVSQTDRYEQQSSAALEEMRTAKGRLVKDLRFADAIDTVTSDAHNVVIAVDADIITWTLEADGTLTRTVGGSPAIHASDLVYDAAAISGSSRFLYDAAGTTITIELVADVDSAEGPAPKDLTTEVHLRNV